MIIANLKGGLGNQMFQYAMGRSLAKRNNTELKLDINFLQTKHAQHVTQRHYELSIFKISSRLAPASEILALKNPLTRILHKALPNYTGNPYVQEKFFQFDPKILNLFGNYYLEGHWMSEKYFEEIDPIVRSEFTFKDPVIAAARGLDAKIHEANSVCIHIRRGDYVNNPTVTSVHGVTPLEYFNSAVAMIRERILNPVFFVFSDDSDWCYENFRDITPIHFIERELRNSPATNSDFLQLMSGCKHFIISNSTFSWWGAWLSKHPEKIVIAPKKWFNTTTIDTSDVCPTSWIRI